jgi:hypothetical protein
VSGGWKPSDGHTEPASVSMTPDGYLVETPPSAWDEYAMREAQRM